MKHVTFISVCLVAFLIAAVAIAGFTVTRSDVAARADAPDAAQSDARSSSMLTPF